MFSFNSYSPRQRSVSQSSNQWGTQSEGEGTLTRSQASSPTSSIASSRASTQSTATNGVKSKLIRDLKLELEMKDYRVTELETAFEDMERQAAFREGELEHKLEAQEEVIGSLKTAHETFQKTISEQNAKLSEMAQMVEQFRSMHENLKFAMTRCSELEELQRKRNDEIQKAEAAKKEAEEAAKKEAEEAALKEAEEAALKAQRQQALMEEAARLETEREAAEQKRKEAEAEEMALREAVRVQEQRQVETSQPAPANRKSQAPQPKKSCVIA